MSTLEEVFEAAKKEREYQDAKWGTLEEHPHTLLEWGNIVLDELTEVGVAALVGDYDQARREVLQVLAVCIACLQQHGIILREEG